MVCVEGTGGWGICCAILSNPGSITHQHHLSPFTFEVSWTGLLGSLQAGTGGTEGRVRTLPAACGLHGVCGVRHSLKAGAEVEGGCVICQAASAAP